MALFSLKDFGQDTAISELSADVAAVEASNTALTAQKKPYGVTAVVLGDSLNMFGERSPFEWATFLSNGKIQYLYNAAVNGDTVEGALARIQTDVIAKAPKICIVALGTNNSDKFEPTTYETIVTTLLSNEIIPILCTIPPFFYVMDGVYMINLFIKHLTRKYKLDLIDCFSVVNDPSNANGAILSAYRYDTYHWNAAGAKVLGQLIVDQVGAKIPAAPAYLPQNTHNNAVTNGLFTTDTNADGLADGWAKSGAGAYSPTLTDDAAIVGKWQNFQKTVNDTNPVVLTESNITISATNTLTPRPGEKIALCMRLKTADIVTGTAKYTLKLKYTGATPSEHVLMSAWSQDIDCVIYREITLPSPCTAIALEVSITQGTGTVSVAQLGIYNLSMAENFHMAKHTYTHATISNMVAFLRHGLSKTWTITADSTYTMSSVLVKMGGVDITSSVYTPGTGVVLIPSVTGLVEITATAV